MDKDIAIKVEHLSKTFRIPHEKVSSLRGAFVGMFRGKRTFEEFQALDDVSFEVKKGEFFGIIGRNGSGKSTLLKILAGIYQPDKGKVSVNGMISPFLELGIGFNPELSGRDNVYLNATVLGLTKKQIDRKFDDIMKFSELERFIDQKLKNYSSGMQVRLAFSVAIHANRDILLMDEVLAVGDSNFQSKCLEEFSKYRDMGRTVILVSHDISTIQRYCDRAMLLRNGKVVKIGKAEEVSNEYIRENIGDADARLSDANNCGIIKNISSVAQIKSVEFLNNQGQKKSAFFLKEDIIVRVFFDIIHANEKVFNFGFGLYNGQDQYLFGVSTVADKIDTKEIVKRGFFDLHLKNVILSDDIYYVKASVVGKNFSSSSLYAFVERSSYFNVISNKITEGMLGLDYEWK